MTVLGCYNFCATAGWSLFGIEYAGECYCGDVLQAGSVAAPEADCNMACSGDATTMCGGPNRLSVYSAS